MSDPIRAVVLGIVEGLTEFLPVSSTGHMILVERWPLRIPQGDRFWTGAFDIFIQIGAILAVLVYFWRRLWRLACRPAARVELHAMAGATVEAGDPPVVLDASQPPLVRVRDHILVKLFVAFLPAAIVGALAGDYVEEHLKNPHVVAAALVIGGIAIILIERCMRQPWVTDAGSISLATALGIGVFQCLALIPGTSRSAATIMGALLLGLSAPAAAEFSFFLAIPTMFAAGGYSLLKHRDEIQTEQLALLGLGFFVAFVVALVVVAGFMRYIQTHRFTPFAVYRIVLGVVVLALL